MNTEIDLIPADYRRQRRLGLWLRRSGFVYLGLVLSLGLARAGLGLASQSHARELVRMEAAQAELQGQQARLETLRLEKTRLEQRLAVLDGLRGGPGAERILLAVDRALDGTVQFLDWKFRRAGELVERGPETVQTGYFLVVPAEKSGSRKLREREQAWRLATHMEIRARAADHSSLANFVSRLVQQSEIESVRVLNTRARQYTSSEAVDFELAVLVRAPA